MAKRNDDLKLSDEETELQIDFSDEESPIASVKSETEDASSTTSHYDIISIPADFTLEGLVSKHEKKQLVIPGFQRKFVWTQRQASRLVESFLLGLPVPALFLYSDTETGKLQVIDGQQRLTSVIQFFGGFFQNAGMAKPKLFSLAGLAADSPYDGLTYKELETKHPATYANLNDSVMRAFMIKQLDPNDATSIFHIFERLNTGGTILQGQEIRNCVYHGNLNDLINELNECADWRRILGKPKADSRMRDVEMVLRFVALYYCEESYKKPMKDFLSTVMKLKRNIPESEVTDLKRVFEKTCGIILSELGDRPFHLDSNRMNPAVFDAVFTCIARYQGKLRKDLKSCYDQLIASSDFRDNSSYRTTDVREVKQRLHLAKMNLVDTL
jgi:hypothetical protein